MEKKFYMIRHGECLTNTLGLSGGWFDDGLTQIGRSQIFVASSQIIPIGISMMYCSTLRRARETAKLINFSINKRVPIIYSDHIKEKNNGPYLTCKTYPEIDRITGKDTKTWSRGDSFDYRPYLGESIIDVTRRIQKGVEEIKAYSSQSGWKHVLAVSHSGIIRILLMLYGMMDEWPDRSLPNGGIFGFNIDQEVDWHMFDKNVPEHFELYQPPKN